MPAPARENVDDRLSFAVAIAHEAGELTLKYFRKSDLAVERKADQSPVTVADRAAETLLRERISSKFPEDAILGEEFGSKDGTSGYQWVLDPIDGTKSFIHGVPLYTTLIAVLHHEELSLGVIHAPATGETVFAAKGGGCNYQASPAASPQITHVSSVATLAEGLVLTSEVETFKQHASSGALDYYLRLQSTARLARTWGDGYGYLMVATGRAEVMIDPVMNLWDAAPLQTVIEEAGGTFTDWNGSPTIRAGESIATNGHVAQQVLGLRNSVK